MHMLLLVLDHFSGEQDDFFNFKSLHSFMHMWLHLLLLRWSGGTRNLVTLFKVNQLSKTWAFRRRLSAGPILAKVAQRALKAGKHYRPHQQPSEPQVPWDWAWLPPSGPESSRASQPLIPVRTAFCQPARPGQGGSYSGKEGKGSSTKSRTPHNKSWNSVRITCSPNKSFGFLPKHQAVSFSSLSCTGHSSKRTTMAELY